VRFTGHSSIVGHQYGNNFLSPFRHLQFGESSQIFVKFVYTWPTMKYVVLFTIKSYFITRRYKTRYRIISTKQNW
jgi:hypothetical protein